MIRSSIKVGALVAAVGTLSACATLYNDAGHAKRIPIPFALDSLSPEHQQYSLARGLKLFGEQHEVYADKNCLIFRVSEDIEPNATYCYRIEGDQLVQERTTYSSSIYLPSWYGTIESEDPPRWILKALEEDLVNTQLHHQYADYLKQVTPRLRILEPFGLLTRAELQALKRSMPLIDVVPEKFEDYADNRYYRKRWVSNFKMPGQPKVRVYFASPFFDINVAKLHVTENPEIEALVRAVAYDYFPESFDFADERLSVHLHDGVWRLRNRGQADIQLSMLETRYHESKHLMLDPETTDPLLIPAGSEIVVDGRKALTRHFMFPKDRYVGIRDWQQKVRVSVRMKYQFDGQEYVLKRSEEYVVKR